MRSQERITIAETFSAPAIQEDRGQLFAFIGIELFRQGP